MYYGFPSVQYNCSYACAWRHTAALQGTERTKRRLALLRSMLHGQRCTRMSKTLCRTVCTVSLLLLEKKCHARWVRATCNQAQRDPALRPPVHWLSRDGKYQCLLLLKDDLSGYLWLVPCRTANAAATVDALMRWFAVFGVVLLWISDRGRNFKNEAVRRVQQELKAKHHFTTANCPWLNGTIESACKQVIRAFRATLPSVR
jgi:transposase InsO family protein